MAIAKRNWRILVPVFVLFLIAGSVIATSVMGEDKEKSVTSAEEVTPWQQRCVPVDEAGNQHCDIFQKIIHVESGKRVIEFVIGYQKDRAVQTTATGIMILPLGMYLPNGATMQIDENQPFRFEIRTCKVDGCFAYLDLNENILALMRKGKEAKISFQSQSGQNVNIALSLKGFTKALESASS